MTKNTNIVLCSYGNEVEYKRAIFAILSFWSWFERRPAVRILVYTDNSSYFNHYLSDFEIEYADISLDEINEINSVTGHQYRIKIAIIEKTFLRFPDDGLLYLDTDIFFIANPESLFGKLSDTSSVMHLREYTLAQAVDIYRWMNTDLLDAQAFPRSLIKHIESKTYHIGNIEANFDRQNYIWNAGVIGVAKEMAAYIPAVYTLCDDFYNTTQWRVSEQLAFTLVLGTITSVSECGDIINHYWHYKDRVDIRLTDILSSAFRQAPKHEKLVTVQKFIIKLKKMLTHEKMMTQTKDHFREKDFKNAIKFAIAALRALPLNNDFFAIIKYRISQLRPKV